MKFTSISRLRSDAKAVLESIEKEGEPFLVIQDSRPRGVLISLEEYEALRDSQEEKEDIRVFDEAKKHPYQRASWDDYAAKRSRRPR